MNRTAKTPPVIITLKLKWFRASMIEPSCFIRGKQFQYIVMYDFNRNNKDGLLGFEKTRKLLNNKTGRLDILVSELGDYISVYEIKATNWDIIKLKNIIKNAWRHQHQLFKHINTYTKERLDVC